MVGDTAISLWDVTSAEPAYEADFVAGGPVDVAIVGGGFTGLSTALHCAQKGLSAHVLEAKSIGYGGSGRNVGLVNAGVWLPPAKVISQMGEQVGGTFLQRFGDAPQAVFDLIETHQIRCEVTKTGTIHAAHSPAGMRNLQERHAQWQALGAPVDLLDRDTVARKTGSTAFHGGLLDRRAGTINPMGYVRGLARAAKAAGAEISTGVRVTGLARDNGQWRVTTDQGDMLARNVVLGTNAYSDDLWPGLNKVFTTIHFLQCATAPLGPEADHILPDRQGVWDTAPIMMSARRDAAGRLIVGSMGKVFGTADTGLTRRWAARQVRRYFPELGDVTFEEAWHGQIAMTPDHLPRIHNLAEGLWTPIGYSGRGITTGTVFGQAMAGLLTGMDPSELPLPLTEISRAPASGLATKFYDLAFAANQLWKTIR